MLEVAFFSDDRERGKLTLDDRRLHGLTRLAPHAVRVTEDLAHDRRPVETLVEQTYAQAYCSRIDRHYPALMSVHDAEGTVLAAVGFRSAGSSKLFLEQYLHAPIEHALSPVVGENVPRAQIVEIGSLASRGNGASLFLFVALAALLSHRGFGYAVATATDTLRTTFRYFGFHLVELGCADRMVLDDGGAAWGTYYDSDPQVVASAIAPSCEKLRRFLPQDQNRNLDSVLSSRRSLEHA